MTLKYLRIQPGRELPDITDLRPFCAVVIVEEEVNPAWQRAVSRWLVDSGCLYMMAWGSACSSWDTSVDIATLETCGVGDIPDRRFVMTTSHEDEALSEVFWFCRNVAAHPSCSLGNVLLLHIGERDREAEFLEAYREAPPDAPTP